MNAQPTRGPGRPKKDEALDKILSPDERISTPPNLTPEEAAIFQRVATEGGDWRTITEGDVEEFSLMEDPLKLPPEAKQMERDRKFKFRWASMDPRRIDQLRNAVVPMKWWICNRSQTPFLEKYCDPIHGGVQRLDQILLFKPWWMHEKHQAAKNEIADIQLNSGDINKRHGIKADELGSEYLAGEKYKISDKDEVMDPGNMLESAYANEQHDNSSLGDLVVDQ